MKRRGRQAWVVVAAVLLSLSLGCRGVANAAGPVMLNGRWNYRDGSDAEEQFTHRYNASYHHRVQLNQAMLLNGGIRYSKNYLESRDSSSLSPDLNLDLANYLFRLNLSGSYTESRSSDRPASRQYSWDSNWQSRWNRRFWPRLRASYGQSFNRDDQEPQGSDSQSNDADASVNWDLELARLSYRISRQESINNLTGGENTRTSHFARLDANRRFLNDRLSLGFSQDYRLSRQEFTSVTDSTGTALRPVSITQVWAGEDDPPPEDLATGPLDEKPKLVDEVIEGNPPDVTGFEIDPDLFAERPSIVLRVNFDTVDVVHLYGLDDLGDFAGDFRWDVYTSNNGTDWQLELLQVAPTVTVSGTDWTRQEIEVGGLQVRYINLVADTGGLQPDDVTAVSEVEAFDRLAGSGGRVTQETENSSYGTDVSMGLRLRDDLRFSYSAQYEVGESVAGTDTRRLSQSGGVSWTASPSLSMRAGVSDLRDEVGDLSESASRGYSFSLTSRPIHTIDLNLGLSRNESFEGGELRNTSHSVNLLAGVRLYRDLTSRINLGYGTSTNEESGEESDSFSARILLTARLTPRLTASLTESYSRSSGGDATSDSYRTNASINWRLSQPLFLRISGNHFLDPDGRNSYGLNTQLGLVPNRIHRLSFGYSYTGGDEASGNHAMDASWYWAINRVFTLNTSGSYTFAEAEDTWAFQTRLKAGFSGF